MEVSRTLQEYHEIADDIARMMPMYSTPNPFLTKDDFDEVIKRTDHAVHNPGFTLNNTERWWVLGVLEGRGVIRSIFGTDDVSEIYLTKQDCETCHRKPGSPRSDNGLPAGRHCDECWESLVSSCRSRSW
ncbi:MAG: hypothetical protein WC479_05505 [Candidatus Izemoplasmatales bacterium]|jgi:hypothetical protein